ncbi:methionyl-tRNA formyltransferase [Pectinatus frisingensis]|uniref:methionyl-tRNA formyltransferase n=1 Tax=Pectinatus frisingensis TaxID=865 RepID=UPI0018C7AEE0|nr:methionyl-tRNA formyltransferase [Pectinatus frisingensis]
MVNVVVSNKDWHKNFVNEIERITHSRLIYINDKSMVNYKTLIQYNPRYIFFPHWSNIVPAEVYDNFECVIFHMTDLPFGRGGSPLQNLLVRGIYNTKLSAIRCVKDLDAGAVYMKMPLSLYGNAEEIYLRASNLTKKMIINIIMKNMHPSPQNGCPVNFKRRKKEDGCINGLKRIEEVFDYIRMLDAEGYPRAFINIGRFHIEFERASLKNGYIKADAKIVMKEDYDEQKK